MNNRHQTGLWIDGAILYSDLNLNEKVILADVLILSKGSNIFYKTDATIARQFNVSVRTIQRTVKSLKAKGLILVSITRPYGNVKIKRHIHPCLNAIADYCDDKCVNC